MTAGAHITFLDDDHVLRIAWLALTAPRHELEVEVQRFMEPEAADTISLIKSAAGLRTCDGTEVSLAAHAGRSMLANATILIFRRGKIDRTLLNKCPRLRFVQRFGESTEGIDLRATAERKLWVSCLARRTLRNTAEHAVMLMMALARNLLPADRAARAGSCDREDSVRSGAVHYNWARQATSGGLFGKTLGIVGMGEVGNIVATIARGVGMRVIYTSPTRRAVTLDVQQQVENRDFDALLQEADFVSLHAPDTDENVGLMGETQFQAMRRDAYFVNTSRGRLVDEQALYRALHQGRIAGAGLDVHATEPRSASDPFCQLSNVILTPHVGGGLRSGVLAEIDAMFANCRDVLAGNVPRHGYVTPPARA
jgi:phosphoglycerate dehydrogenase-like enzyme